VSSPNNILAIEYLSALDFTDSKMKPCVIKRTGNNYNDTEITTYYPSATALRERIKDGLPLQGFTDEIVANSDFLNLADAHENLYNLFRKKVLEAGVDTLKDFAESAEGLDYLIYNAASERTSYASFLDSVKNKSITMSRIKRMILAIMCDIIPNFADNFIKIEPYFNVLAYNEKGKSILPRENALLSFKDKDTLSTAQKEYLQVDQKADLLFHLIHNLPYKENAFFLTKNIL
jgi:predicted nucleotidyltransferase